MEPESPRLSSKESTRVSKLNPKSSRKCHCKQSKCLKMYCECFASGAYCDECSCTNCHNNIENEAIRRSAVESVLERNPNAFRPKIATSPGSRQADGGKEMNVLLTGKHNRGCHCKRTGCVKKYCECFQASIACSENCKCVNCKNLERIEHRTAHSWQGFGNSNVSIERTNVATFAAIGSSSFAFPRKPRKRTFRKVLDSNRKDQEIQMPIQGQEVNPVTVSGLFPSFSVDPACCITSSTNLSSSKYAYRSLLAHFVHPLGTRELCSLLVVASEVLTKSHSSTLSLDVSRSCGTHEQEDRTFSPQWNDKLMFDEGNKSFMGVASLEPKLNHGFTPDVYMEQERLLLTCLRSFLAKLLTFGTIKAVALSKAES